MDPDFEFKPNSPIIKKDHRGVEYILVWMPLEQTAKDYRAALQKMRQLDREIDSDCSSADLHHTLSKLWIFARELTVQAVRDRAHALKTEKQ